MKDRPSAEGARKISEKSRGRFDLMAISNHYLLFLDINVLILSLLIWWAPIRWAPGAPSIKFHEFFTRTLAGQSASG